MARPIRSLAAVRDVERRRARKFAHAVKRHAVALPEFFRVVIPSITRSPNR